MGCGGSKDDAARPSGGGGYQGGGGGGVNAPGWGQPGNQVRAEMPNQSDPPFMQTMAPSGTSWGQYCRTGSSFVDSRSGLLAGPFAECIAWAVVFEHNNDWSSMPQYQADGVVGGVLQALERQCGGRQDVMQAANRLEDLSHQLAETGQPLPAINQVMTVPPNAQPGQYCRIPNQQAPGTYMNVQVPPNVQPGQQFMAPVPIQPTQDGKNGTSMGTKLAYAAGGAVVAGAVAGAVYYGTVGGGMDGFVGDMGAAGGAIGDAAGSVGDAVTGADYGGMADSAGEWVTGAGEDVGEFAGSAFDGASDFITDLF